MISRVKFENEFNCHYNYIRSDTPPLRVYGMCWPFLTHRSSLPGSTDLHGKILSSK
jgi:hypothetical protein